jgi:hypothetical protein
MPPNDGFQVSLTMEEVHYLPGVADFGLSGQTQIAQGTNSDFVVVTQAQGWHLQVLLALGALPLKNLRPPTGEERRIDRFSC